MATPGWSDWRRHGPDRQFRSLYDFQGDVLCHQWDNEAGSYSNRDLTARLTVQQVREFERSAGIIPRTTAPERPVRTHQSDYEATEVPTRPRIQYTLAVRERRDETRVQPRDTRHARHGSLATIATSPLSQPARRPSDAHARRGTGYRTENTRAEAHRNETSRTDTAYFTSPGAFTERHSSFFEPGRVFRTEWAEPTGTTSLSAAIDGVYRSRRPMVVVKTFDVHSICLPVFSYQAVGVAKHGLKRAEIEQHSIIHMSDIEPQFTAQEVESGRHRFLRTPIMVLSEEGATLATSSRIRYDMPLTFKHNLKVRNVGIVGPDDLDRLVRYWLEAMARE